MFDPAPIWESFTLFEWSTFATSKLSSVLLLSKHLLSEMEARVEQIHDINDMITEESNRQHLRHLTLISNLKNELAQEVDDHSQSESSNGQPLPHQSSAQYSYSGLKIILLIF